MKSKVSNDALHNSFELAKSNSPALFPKVLPKLKPLPSSIFFNCLSFTCGGILRASAPLIPLEEFKSNNKIINFAKLELKSLKI